MVCGSQKHIFSPPKFTYSVGEPVTRWPKLLGPWVDPWLARRDITSFWSRRSINLTWTSGIIGLIWCPIYCCCCLYMVLLFPSFELFGENFEFQFELVLIVGKMQELRSIRIQKMKKQGAHCYAYCYAKFIRVSCRSFVCHWVFNHANLWLLFNLTFISCLWL